jgi:mevalonate kinase
LQQDSLRQFFIETTIEQENRDEEKISKLKEDIRSNVKLLSELNLGTPIISAIKSKLEDAKTVQTR